MADIDNALSRWLPAALLLGGAAGWWWSLHMAADMAAMAASMPEMAMAQMLSLTGFLFGWTAMMAAMMLPIWSRVPVRSSNTPMSMPLYCNTISSAISFFSGTTSSRW